ncbi:hypothetical protein [Kitasatospora sp. NPDC059327]|uniref:hypothetical protein n=1 Tax=Kitasatospora sp. NPDC059327 TaxID=3346803 RepID=UPI00369B7FDA
MPMPADTLVHDPQPIANRSNPNGLSCEDVLSSITDLVTKEHSEFAVMALLATYYGMGCAGEDPKAKVVDYLASSPFRIVLDLWEDKIEWSMTLRNGHLECWHVPEAGDSTKHFEIVELTYSTLWDAIDAGGYINNVPCFKIRGTGGGYYDGSYLAPRQGHSREVCAFGPNGENDRGDTAGSLWWCLFPIYESPDKRYMLVNVENLDHGWTAWKSIGLVTDYGTKGYTGYAGCWEMLHPDRTVNLWVFVE